MNETKTFFIWFLIGYIKWTQEVKKYLISCLISFSLRLIDLFIFLTTFISKCFFFICITLDKKRKEKLFFWFSRKFCIRKQSSFSNISSLFIRLKGNHESIIKFFKRNSCEWDKNFFYLVFNRIYKVNTRSKKILD